MFKGPSRPVVLPIKAVDAVSFWAGTPGIWVAMEINPRQMLGAPGPPTLKMEPVDHFLT